MSTANCRGDPDAPSASPFPTKERIAIVIQDDNTRKLLNHVFVEDGFDVLQLGDADDVLSSIALTLPSLVVLDCSLRRHDSYALCGSLREEQRTGLIPVLLLGAGDASVDRVKAMESGADDYIQGPYDHGELVLRIKRLLGQFHDQKTHPREHPISRLRRDAIQKIEGRLFSTSDWALLYVDLHNFRAFNDRYGSAKGDQILQALGRIIVEAVIQRGEQEDIVSHLGCDRYVVATTVFNADSVARQIIQDFEQALLQYRDKTHQATGRVSRERRARFIEHQNRPAADGQPTEGEWDVPSKSLLPSVLIGIVTRENTDAVTLGEIIEIARQVRGLAKGRTGSAYVKDRRVVSVGQDT
ncbi:MAG: diguanylate cyclase [Chloroflexi bacterium]|nr:diguanylate cyclase [Chloroflexota bacterium]